MTASMMSSAEVAPVSRAASAQASMVAPFSGLKSLAGFPCTRKVTKDITKIASNGSRVQCMKLTMAPQSHHHPKPTTALAESANLSIRNPNKRIGIYYDRIDARGYYRGQRFDSVELGRFFQGHKKTNKLTVEFQGQNLVMLGENLFFLFLLNLLQFEAPIRICGYLYLGIVVLMMDGGWRLKVEVVLMMDGGWRWRLEV
ncbi:hypothetical protein LguiA_000575 [Lonicera macranthoides]